MTIEQKRSEMLKHWEKRLTHSLIDTSYAWLELICKLDPEGDDIENSIKRMSDDKIIQLYEEFKKIKK